MCLMLLRWPASGGPAFRFRKAGGKETRGSPLDPSGRWRKRCPALARGSPPLSAIPSLSYRNGLLPRFSLASVALDRQTLTKG